MSEEALPECKGAHARWATESAARDGTLHVWPLDDTYPHMRSDTCPCNPSVELNGAAILIAHMAFDNRESQSEATLAMRN